MIPRMCMSLHNPPRSYGDCIRACVATITDDDQVPHVFTDKYTTEESWHQLRSYLKSKGRFLIIYGVKDMDPFEFMAETNPDIPYMLFHETAKGGNHVVVCENDKMFHDPAYYKSPIKGPCSEGQWVIAVIGSCTWNQ